MAVSTADECYWVVRDGAVFMQRWAERNAAGNFVCWRTALIEQGDIADGTRLHIVRGEVVNRVIPGGVALTYVCEGHVFHSMTVVTDEGRDGAAQAFKQMHGAFPDAVGDDDIVGGCESCQQPIFGDQKQHTDYEGVEWHCAPHCCECAFTDTTEGSVA